MLLRFLWPFRSVERTGLSPAFHASSIQSTSKDVVAHAREILHTATANQHDAVFLEVVSLAWDVRINLFSVSEAHPGHLPHR